MNKRKLANNEMHSTNFLKRAKIAVEGPLKENVIRYYLMPSLEHISAVKIVITLWSRADIQDEIIKLSTLSEGYNSSKDMNKLCQGVKNKILDMVLELSEFDVIRKILSDTINPIWQEIFDWMEYQDNRVFCNNYRYQDTQYIAVNYLDSLVWTSRGIIDYKETAKTLLAKEQLSDNNKYHLACTHCFEDDIAIIIPRVVDTVLDLWFFDIQTMVYFWTAHLTGDFTELNKMVYYYNANYKTNCSINECVFRVLACDRVDSKNPVAIKYMFNKLSDEEKSRQIVSVVKEIRNTDIQCFFLSQMNAEQQQEVFKANANHILLSFFDNWLWKDYFLPTIHHIWDIMSGLDYLRVLEGIKDSMIQHYEDVEKYNGYKAISKELWRSAPKYLKEFIFEFQNGSRGRNIFLGLLCKKNIDVIQLMLPDINDIQKKTIIFSYRSINKCYWLIINDQLDVVEMFMSSTLVSEEDINMFKQMLVKDRGHDIAVHFIQNQEWGKVEQFMQWAFKSEEEIREFKEDLAYSKICIDILETIVASNKADFEELENHFKWCSSNISIIVDQFKAEIPELFTEVICKLIEEDKYQFLEQILNWCFLNSQPQIDQFKQHFYQDHDNFEVLELVVNLVKKDNQLQSLEEFTHWCFTNEEEINKFKEWILRPTKDTLGVCIELLCKGMFKLADEFVHWCCNALQIQVCNFKNELMVYDHIDDLFEQYNHDGKILGEVIKWFNPPKEIIIQFKEKFVDSWWLKDVLAILDNYVQRQEDNLCQDIENDINDVLQDLLSNVENQCNNMINSYDNLTVNHTGTIEDTNVIL
ncbi:hypothetical protein RHORCCE3_2308 [Rickettsia hoogstraalii str. RCCE3]|nr:hypothetical protein RHORCCE3_2308 [Rickettsia hoogstraalii str. RCCE3]